jgi:hypothetical protein
LTRKTGGGTHARFCTVYFVSYFYRMSLAEAHAKLNLRHEVRLMCNGSKSWHITYVWPVMIKLWSHFYACFEGIWRWRSNGNFVVRRIDNSKSGYVEFCHTLIPGHISGIFLRIRFQCFFHKNHAFRSQRLHLTLYLGFFKVILFLEWVHCIILMMATSCLMLVKRYINILFPVKPCTKLLFFLPCTNWL